MKAVVAVSTAALFLAGCVSDPGLYLDTMKGAGSARTMPDGSSGFTFAISENAYDGIIPRDDRAKLRAQHAHLIANWAGQTQTCPRGYQVGAPTTTDGVIVYEGFCR